MIVASLPGSSRARAAVTVRGLTAAATLGIGLLVTTVWSFRYREMEASLAAWFTNFFTPAFSFNDRWVVEPDDGKSVILVVTSSCTTSLLVAPLFVAAAWAILLRRLRPSATLAGLVAGVVVLLTLGTIRMFFVGLAWHRWGRSSAWFSHDVLGTLITVLSAATALGVLLVIASRGSRAKGRDFTGNGERGDAQ